LADVQFDETTWQAIDLLGRDTMKDFQELADEAFADLLRKHERPVGLKAALRQSAQSSDNVHPFERLPPGAETKSKKKPKRATRRAG
jgi:hypothetical protein